jgi:hypothetical protein
MERIIYLDNELGYKYADIKNHQDLLSKEHKLTRRGYLIVCVLDLTSQIIIERCETFSIHTDFIKSCYPNIDLGQNLQSSLPQLVIAN